MTKTKMKGDPNCPHCHGAGFIPLNEEDEEYKRLVEVYGEYAEAYMTVKRCICLERMRFRSKVGNAIYNADIIEENMLEAFEHSNLFLQANRSDFLAHLRSFLWNRPLEFYWRMTTDMDLLDVFLDKNEERSSIANFARGPELLIVQLGAQSYKNVALPGIVLECLKARQFVDKPTWVVNPHELNFRQDHHLAWSPDLEYHLEAEYTKRSLKAERQKLAVDNGFGFESSLDHGQAGSPSKGNGKNKGAAKFRDIEL